MVRLSIILPVYNEAKVIEGVVRGFYEEVVRKFPDSELVVAEDGSTDGTKEILRKLNREIPFRLVSEPRKKGYLRACRDALKLAKGELVFFSDTDGTHDPRDFWKLYEKIGRYDLASGCRFRRADPLHRKVLSRGFNRIVSLMFGVKLRDFNSGFKLMRKEVVDAVVDKVRLVEFGFSTELVVRAAHAGFKVGEVEVSHAHRRFGEAAQFTPGKLPGVVMKQMAGLIKLMRELSR